MKNKKTKLTISGNAKKSIGNIELAKTQNKNSVVIEKKTSRFGNRSSFSKSNTQNVTSKKGSYVNENPTNFLKPKFSIRNNDEKRKLAEIYDEIKNLYQSDERPWILGFSGGKDSTCMAQLVWNAIVQLPEEKRSKKIYIIGCDTLVESPKIVERLKNTLSDMQVQADQQNLPIQTNMVKPDLADTFWVLLLGKGYPAPSSQFRWCTERLKIKNGSQRD